jgi:ABC-type phosphate/phosphonate transport system substrate-binding protein
MPDPGDTASFVANARMYSVTPAAAKAWKQLFAWLADASGHALQIIDHAFPAPLGDLWARPDLGAAFICGYPYALSGKRQPILAAPVPVIARYGRQPIYMTDFIVRADSCYLTLEDTFGARLGHTVEDSHSGFNVVRHHLLAYRTAERPRLYRATVGPLYTPRKVVEAVLAGDIDVGPLDGYAMDLLRRHEPNLVARLRVVATTAPAPIPMLIASPDCPPQVVAALRSALLGFGAASETADIRDALCLSHFVAVEPEAYDLPLAWAAAATTAGYPMPG